jgi:hypothetical protein
MQILVNPESSQTILIKLPEARTHIAQMCAIAFLHLYVR